MDNLWPTNKMMCLDNGDCNASVTGINGIPIANVVQMIVMTYLSPIPLHGKNQKNKSHWQQLVLVNSVNTILI